MQQVTKSVKEAAQDVRNFLAENKQAREKNADTFRREIQARVKEIKKNTQDFISDSASRRTAVFQEMMKDITSSKGTASKPQVKKRGRKKKEE